MAKIEAMQALLLLVAGIALKLARKSNRNDSDL